MNILNFKFRKVFSVTYGTVSNMTHEMDIFYHVPYNFIHAVVICKPFSVINSGSCQIPTSKRLQ